MCINNNNSSSSSKGSQSRSSQERQHRRISCYSIIQADIYFCFECESVVFCLAIDLNAESEASEESELKKKKKGEKKQLKNNIPWCTLSLQTRFGPALNHSVSHKSKSIIFFHLYMCVIRSRCCVRARYLLATYSFHMNSTIIIMSPLVIIWF